MVLPRYPHGIPMGFTWCPHGAPVVPPWCLLSALIVPSWCFRGKTMVLPWYPSPGVHIVPSLCLWRHHGTSVLLPRCPHGVPMVPFRAVPMVAPWCPYCAYMVLPWCLHDGASVMPPRCGVSIVPSWCFRGASMGASMENHTPSSSLHGAAMEFTHRPP